MSEPRAHLRTLDYAGPLPAVRVDRPPFRWGIAAMTCSIFAAAGLAFCHIMHSPTDAYIVLLWINVVGLGFGIGGAFQRSGRSIAIIGAMIAVTNLLLLPVFGTA